MRCLYCGKHLPLLRKLTGGGEFCSDAHRNKYHEEYNRLAVSRLLQAQSRPEELKPSTRGAPEEIEQGATVAVAEEPEPEVVSSSFIDVYKTPQIRPAVAQTQVEIQVAPLLLESWELVYPCIEPAPRHPQLEGGFLAWRPSLRQIATAFAETGPPSHYDVEHVLPPPSEFRFADCHPAEAGPLALALPSTPRTSNIEPLDLGVSAIELSQPKPVIAELSSFWDGPGLPRAGSRQLVLSPVAVADDANLEIGLIENFPDFEKFRPAFELRLKLLETSEIVPPEPERQTVADSKAEVVLLTPRKVLEALCADRKQKKAQEPPLSRTIKAIAIPSATPVTEVLAAGFDAILFEARPRLLHYNTQPLRPKMAIGNAAGPFPARSGHDGTTIGHEAHIDGGKNTSPKIMHRSMLHLEDETRASDTDTEVPSLFGKLGGLFGKKSRTGKQEVGSQK